MTPEQIFEMLIDILVRDLGIEVPRERTHSSALLQEDLGLDSVALLGLIAAIEKRLGFELADAVLRPSTFRTVGSVAEAVAASIAAQPAAG
jgi:acyl carrier protein